MYIRNFSWAHLRQFIHGVGKSQATQKIHNGMGAELSSKVLTLGSRGMENLVT